MLKIRKHKEALHLHKKPIFDFQVLAIIVLIIVIVIAAVLASGLFGNTFGEKKTISDSNSALKTTTSDGAQTQAAAPANEPATIEFTRTNKGREQDCITQNVCIARNSTQGIFNSKTESSYSSASPKDTEWYFGSFCKNGLSFKPWVEAVKHNPRGSVNVPACLHLITDNLYFNITFTSFSGGGSGGGFSYERTQTTSN